MQLTEDERAALERWRECQGEDEAAATVDALRLMGLLMRLFPVRTYGNLVIRWDHPITPERLVACGFVGDGYKNSHDVDSCFTLGECQATTIGSAVTEFHVRAKRVYPKPRNMLDVWQLMERCGIEEGGK